jgi:hypothetical protein
MSCPRVDSAARLAAGILGRASLSGSQCDRLVTDEESGNGRVAGSFAYAGCGISEVADIAALPGARELCQRSRAVLSLTVGGWRGVERGSGACEEDHQRACGRGRGTYPWFSALPRRVRHPSAWLVIDLVHSPLLPYHRAPADATEPALQPAADEGMRLATPNLAFLGFLTRS